MWAYIGVYFCAFMHVDIVLQRPKDNVISPEGAGTLLIFYSMWVL